MDLFDEGYLEPIWEENNFEPEFAESFNARLASCKIMEFVLHFPQAVNDEIFGEVGWEGFFCEKPILWSIGKHQILN